MAIRAPMTSATSTVSVPMPAAPVASVVPVVSTAVSNAQKLGIQPANGSPHAVAAVVPAGSPHAVAAVVPAAVAVSAPVAIPPLSVPSAVPPSAAPPSADPPLPIESGTPTENNSEVLSLVKAMNGAEPIYAMTFKDKTIPMEVNSSLEKLLAVTGYSIEQLQSEGALVEL